MLCGVGDAQTQSVTAKKQGEKYIATLPIDTYGYGIPDHASGFLDTVELDVSWWGLFDQPVYYHTLRWTISDAIRVETYKGFSIYFRKSELNRHPDLLKRFNDLRPEHMEITFDVRLQQKSVPAKVGRYGTYFDKYNVFEYSKTVKNVQLTIVRSGSNGENMSPGSPQDNYSEFTDYAVKPSLINSKRKVEQRLKSTFANTGTIVFRNAHISKLELPDAEIKSIYDTLMARERGCRDYIDNPMMWSCAEKNDTLKSDAPQAELVERPQDAGTVTDSGFWENGGMQNSVQEPEIPSEHTITFWEGGGVTDEGSESATRTPAGRASSFEIKTSDQTQGVVSSDGRTLIPFRIWKILKYRDGVAEVSIDERVYKSCRPSKESGEVYLSLNSKKIGSVGQDGEWLIEPRKTYKRGKGVRRDSGLDRKLRSDEPWRYFDSKRIQARFNTRMKKLDKVYFDLSRAEGRRRKNRILDQRLNEAEAARDRYIDELEDCERELESVMRNTINQWEAEGYVRK